jgi:UDP-GlcNAc:undecaprenyl-phosphate GlcNAc-1-phosphate transferase
LGLVGLGQIWWALALLGATAVVSWLAMKPAARLGLRLGLVDLPSTRRTRARPVPTTGGLVVFSVFVAAMVIALRTAGDFQPDVLVKYSALVVGGVVIVILGMLDDRLNLRPHVKLVVQTAVAITMVASGVGIEHMKFLVGPSHQLGWLTYPVTVLWFLGFMNAINLIDGLDGLASGIAAIASAGLFVVGIVNENVLLYLMAAALLGSTLGFLTHNFREGNIYLGDAGSMVLGFFLAGGSVVGAYGDGASNALLVAGACMVVPVFDVVTTIVRRGRSHRGVMTPDRSHTHHRLIRFGLNPRMAVVVLWGVTLFFGGQMLGFVSPHGLVYMMASYTVAAAVANVIIDQHRKNTRTIKSDLKEEVLYIAGVPDAFSAPDAHDGMTLREIIVAQIRREALYRRMVRQERRALSEAEAPAGAAGRSSPWRGAAYGSEHDHVVTGSVDEAARSAARKADDDILHDVVGESDDLRHTG